MLASNRRIEIMAGWLEGWGHSYWSFEIIAEVNCWGLVSPALVLGSCSVDVDIAARILGAFGHLGTIK